MAFNDNKVKVTGLSRDVVETDLELFFESASFCPDGGDVENVDIFPGKGTAIVTFEDPAGIQFVLHFFQEVI